MEKKTVKAPNFEATYIGPKTMEINEMRVWRGDSHPNEIFMKVNGKLTSVHCDPKSKRGNPHLWNLLDGVLNELGIYGKDDKFESTEGMSFIPPRSDK